MLAPKYKVGTNFQRFLRALLCMAAVVICAVSSSLSAQESTKRNIKIKPKDVKNVSKVVLEADGKKYPAFMLYRTNRSDLTLLREGTSDMIQDGYYIPFKVEISAFDKIIIHNRKRTIKASIIGGIGLAAVSYFVVDQLSENNLDSPQLELLGQETNHRFVEPIVAGILGAGVGVIVGEMLAPVKIDLKKDKKEAYRKLRQYSYR